MRILSIGLDRALFDKTSDTFWRVSTYASWFDKYTTIVTTLKSENRVEIKEGSLKVIPTNSQSRLFYPLDILKIALKSKAERFDLVTVQDPFICAIAGILVKILLKIPLNIQIHSEFFNSKYFREENLFNWLLYYVGLLTISFADTIRARNNRIGVNIRQRYPRLKNRVCYVAAPINQIFLTPLKKVSRDKNLVVSIGRDVPQKNLSLLREAVNIAKKEYPKIHLEIIFRGKKSREIKEVLDRAGVFALSSNHEGWGLVVLEALSQGCPVVMTDTGCAGEIVIDSKTGYVVPVGDAKGLAEKIILTLNNYPSSLAMAKKGRKLVENDCALTTIKQQLLAMYEITIRN